ncbi:MAG: aspartate aminotransferase family protein [Nitrospirota bacterium]
MDKLMTGQRLIEESNRYLMDTYKRFPLLIIKGRGTRVYDIDGREFIDFVSGIAVNNLGYCNNKVTMAIQKQAQRLTHISNLYYSEPQIMLAKMLVENSFADKVFFCNSGAEANEAAIKLVRRYAREHFDERYEIITALNSFHGRTMATISATGQERFWKGFEPLLPGFKFVPYNNLNAVADAINSKTAAVMVEPIQGEGGVVVPDDTYLPGLRRLCDEAGLLLVLDEVQTGIGRSGKLFAYEHYKMEPDIITLAKGLGGGIPIGAMLARADIAKSFTHGTHASTFGGNPVACVSALTTIETILEHGFVLDNCTRMGGYMIDGLKRLANRYPFIKDVRGKGLLIAMELSFKGEEIVNECLEEGFLVNCTAERVLRFMPPLIITRDEIDMLFGVLDKIFKKRST